MQAELVPAVAADMDSDSEEGALPVAVLAAQAIAGEHDHDGNDDAVVRNHDQAGDDENHNLPAPVILRYPNLRGRNIDSISSYLFDMIREECTCTSVLAGWSPRMEGCNRIVNHCGEFPEQAFYVAPNGRTALHEACLRGSCRHVIKALLEANSHGAMDRDNHGNTPLHLLFVDFSTSFTVNPYEIDVVVKELLSVNPTFIAASTNMEGSTALHMACAAPETMVESCSLERLLIANPSCATKENFRNQTALRLHCQRRNASTSVAHLLLQVNPNALEVLDGEDGWAPLHYAAANANLELVKFLVDYNPRAAQVRTSHGLTALHLLCRQPARDSHMPAVDVLLQADPDSVLLMDYSNQYTPLHLICRGGSMISLEVLKRLLQTNPKAASIPDLDQYLPLHHACEIGCEVDAIALLLQAYPAAAHAATRKQDTALSLACACNKSVETVRLLIQENPAALTKRNDYGFAPLHCVCRAYQPRMGIVQSLLEACPSCVTLKTNAGETPVHLACSNPGAFVGVLQLLTMAQKSVTGNAQHVVFSDKRMTNKIGNTPCKLLPCYSTDVHGRNLLLNFSLAKFQYTTPAFVDLLSSTLKL